MIEITPGVHGTSGTPITIKGAKAYGGLMLYINSDTTNCKLSYIHGAGTLHGLDDKTMKEVIDKILKLCKGTVLLNTTAKSVFDSIKRLYPIYYQHEVPIGYNGTFQYHVLFKNVINVNGNCRAPVPEKKIGNPATAENKAIIKHKLHELLKAKRRKADYVDDFINSL